LFCRGLIRELVRQYRFPEAAGLYHTAAGDRNPPLRGAVLEWGIDFFVDVFSRVYGQALDSESMASSTLALSKTITFYTWPRCFSLCCAWLYWPFLLALFCLRARLARRLAMKTNTVSFVSITIDDETFDKDVIIDQSVM